MMDTKKDLNDALGQAEEAVERAENKEAVEDLLDKADTQPDLSQQIERTEELTERVAEIKE
ncbi:MAG: hypothetical protein WBV94_07340 [Blastocatellia bacterium]